MSISAKAQVGTHVGSRPASAEQRLQELGINFPAPSEPFGRQVILLVDARIQQIRLRFR
jgi:hypothetical protein